MNERQIIKHNWLLGIAVAGVVAMLIGFARPSEPSPKAAALADIADELHQLNKRKKREFKELKDLVGAVEELAY